MDNMDLDINNYSLEDILKLFDITYDYNHTTLRIVKKRVLMLHPDKSKLDKIPEDQRYKGEVSSKQVFDRLAGTWTYWGWKGNYFTTEDIKDGYDYKIEAARYMEKAMSKLKKFTTNEGKVVEEGIHKNLINNKKLYYDLYNLQQIEGKVN